MAITTEISRNDYVGTGLVSTYDYGFYILASSDLRVVKREADGTETVLALGSDYTVSGVGEPTGGTVTLTAPLENGYTLTIRRVRPITQQTEFRTQTRFYPEGHEDSADHIVMITQQLRDELSRKIGIPESIDPADFDTTFPATIATGANRLLAVNGTSDGLTLSMTAAEIIAASSGGGGGVVSGINWLEPTGDAATDTATIQAALDDIKLGAAGNSHGYIFVGAGDWNINAPLLYEWATRTAAGFTIIGAGMLRTRFINEIASGGPMLVVQPYNGSGLGITGTSSQTLQVTDGRVNSSMVGSHIWITGSSVSDNNGGAPGLNGFLVTAIDADAQTITYSNPKAGAAPDATREIKWAFINSFAYGISIQDVQLSGPIVETPDDHQGIQGYAFYHWEFNRCYFTSFPREAISLTNELGDPGQTVRFRITNCVVQDCATDTSRYLYPYAIDTGKNPISAVTVQNVAVNACGSGIYFKPYQLTVTDSTVNYCKYGPAMVFDSAAGGSSRQPYIGRVWFEGNANGAIWLKGVSSGAICHQNHFNTTFVGNTPITWYGYRFGKDQKEATGATATIATNYAVNDDVHITITGAFDRYDVGGVFSIDTATDPGNVINNVVIKSVVSNNEIVVEKTGMVNVVGDTVDYRLIYGSATNVECTHDQFITSAGALGVAPSYCYWFNGGSDNVEIKRPRYQVLAAGTVKYQDRNKCGIYSIEDEFGILRPMPQQIELIGTKVTSYAFDFTKSSLQRVDVNSSTFQWDNPVGLPDTTPSVGAYNGLEFTVEVTNLTAGNVQFTYDTQYSPYCYDSLPSMGYSERLWVTFYYEVASAAFVIKNLTKLQSSLSHQHKPGPAQHGGWIYGGVVSSYTPNLDEGSIHSIRTSGSAITVNDPTTTIGPFPGQRMQLFHIATGASNVAITWGSGYNTRGLPAVNYSGDYIFIDFYYDTPGAKWIPLNIQRNTLYPYYDAPSAITSTNTSFTPNLDAENNDTVAITSGATFTINNPTYTPTKYNGQTYSIYLKNATVSTIRISWGSDFSTLNNIPLDIFANDYWVVKFRWDSAGTKWFVESFQHVTDDTRPWSITSTDTSVTLNLDNASGHRVAVTSGATFELSNPTYTPTKYNGLSWEAQVINSAGAELTLTLDTDFDSSIVLPVLPNGERYFIGFAWDSASSKWIKRYEALSAGVKRAFGSLSSLSSTATTTITTRLVYQLMVTPTTALAHGYHFTGNTAGRLTYSGAKTKTFRIHADFTVSPSAASQRCIYQFAKNGTVIANKCLRTQWLDIGDTYPAENVSMTLTESLATGDYIEVYCTSLIADSYAHNCLAFNMTTEEMTS